MLRPSVRRSVGDNEESKESLSVLPGARQFLDDERGFTSCSPPIEGEVRADVSDVDSVRSPVTRLKETGRGARKLIYVFWYVGQSSSFGVNLEILEMSTGSMGRHDGHSKISKHMPRYPMWSGQG